MKFFNKYFFIGLSAGVILTILLEVGGISLLAYSYTRSLTGYLPLKDYLDPDNTGKMTCDAYYPAFVLPEVRFDAEFNQVCLSAPVSFTDYSAFTPIAWEWT